MFDIILHLRDSNKTGKAKFLPDTIILNEKNQSLTFSIELVEGWQVDDFLYIGDTYKIIDNADNTYTAVLREDTLPTSTNNWYINFSIVEA